MKLLIVDPDRDLVEMLKSWLKTLGYEVYRAYTGERAKIEWEEQEPDLVLLDPNVKDVDALAMCREMRHKHDALVLVVTEGKDVQDEVRCLESEADLRWHNGPPPSSRLALCASIRCIMKSACMARSRA